MTETAWRGDFDAGLDKGYIEADPDPGGRPVGRMRIRRCHGFRFLCICAIKERS